MLLLLTSSYLCDKFTSKQTQSTIDVIFHKYL